MAVPVWDGCLWLHLESEKNFIEATRSYLMPTSKVSQSLWVGKRLNGGGGTGSKEGDARWQLR